MDHGMTDGFAPVLCVLRGGSDTVHPDYREPRCCGVGHGMDEYGRPLPKPSMFPSAGPNGSLGFRSIAGKLHAMGLRFQLRMERGIPIEAVQQRTKVYGTNYTARPSALPPPHLAARVQATSHIAQKGAAARAH